jgi:hypothetical protein
MTAEPGPPVLHALVAYFSPTFGLCSDPRIMPLEDAIDFQRMGFVVLVDPADERDLTHWEMIQRSVTQKRKSWFD